MKEFVIIGDVPAERRTSLDGTTLSDIVPTFASIGLNADCRYVRVHEQTTKREKLLMMVAETMQNVMDWWTTTLASIHSSLTTSHSTLTASSSKPQINTSSKLVPSKLVTSGLRAFTDETSGLYSMVDSCFTSSSRSVSLTLKSEYNNMPSIDVPSRPEVVPSGGFARSAEISHGKSLKENHSPSVHIIIDSCPLRQTNRMYFIQNGLSMLNFSFLQFGSTTKGNSEQEREELASESKSFSTAGLPVAGGHGIGLKQSFAMFGSRPGWSMQLMGTIPGSPDYVSRWTSASATHSNTESSSSSASSSASSSSSSSVAASECKERALRSPDSLGVVGDVVLSKTLYDSLPEAVRSTASPALRGGRQGSAAGMRSGQGQNRHRRRAGRLAATVHP